MHNFWKEQETGQKLRSCLVKYDNWVGVADQYCLVAEYQKLS